MSDANPKKIASPPPPVAEMVENIIGCKWSLAVLELIRAGTCRPGAMTRAVEGLTTKVLNERLRKLQSFGMIRKQIFPVSPPHVEYHLTQFGDRFTGVLDVIKALQADLDTMQTHQPKVKTRP